MWGGRVSRVARPLLTAWDAEEPSRPTANPYEPRSPWITWPPKHERHISSVQGGAHHPAPAWHSITGGMGRWRTTGACPSKRPQVVQTGFPKTSVWLFHNYAVVKQTSDGCSDLIRNPSNQPLSSKSGFVSFSCIGRAGEGIFPIFAGKPAAADTSGGVSF